MTVVFAQDPTGPDPTAHEIFQIGALFCPDDLSSVREQIGCYITPRHPERAEEAYLSRQRIRSVEELQERTEYWGSPKTVWDHVSALADKAGDGLGSARFVCFDAATSAPFLRRSLRRSGVEGEPMTRNIGGLVQATVDLAACASYRGEESAVADLVRSAGPYDRDKVCNAVFGAHGVSCSRLSDAKERAEAIRQSYRSLFQTLLKSSSSNHGSSTPSSRSGSGRGNSGRDSPTIRRR